MEYIQVHRSFFRHRKTQNLCRILQTRTAWMWPIALWDWCVDNAPDGDLTHVDPHTIEYAINWTLGDGILFSALVKAGFIDVDAGGRTVIHHWMDYQGAAIEKYNEIKRLRSEQGARGNTKRWGIVSNVNENLSLIDRKPIANASQTHRKRIATSTSTSTETKNRTEGSAEGRGPPAGAVDPKQLGFGLGEGEGEETTGPAAPVDVSAVIRTVACVGKVRTWNLTEAYVAAAAGYFPGVDVRRTFLEALYWLDASPDRRKTAGGMPRFLAGWLARNQDRGTTRAQGSGGGGPPMQQRPGVRQAAYPPLSATQTPREYRDSEEPQTLNLALPIANGEKS